MKQWLYELLLEVCGIVLDFISAVIIARRERKDVRGFVRAFWFEYRARRGIIPYENQ